MQILIYLYAGIFSGVAVQGIREDLRFGVPLWKVALSTVASALGVAGMLLYASDHVAPGLRSVWAWVFALIVSEALIQLRFTYRQRFHRVLPEGEASDGQLRSLIWTSVLLGLLAAAPYYWMNAMLAFGPEG
jgi:hypothetical protein